VLADVPVSVDAPGGLPRDLGDGLTLRWATAADAEAVAQFNVRIHSDDPDNQEIALYHWTLDLMRGRHPTTGPADVTVVVDSGLGGKVVSSVLLISQTWAYDGVSFPMGRPELVATDPAYRRRGLIRQQMAAIHARSAAKGELVLGITGIPWYYRQFGYEMALDLDGNRRLPLFRIPDLPKETRESYRLRAATTRDIPLLAELYDIHRGSSPLSRVRDEAEWRWELDGPHPASFHYRRFEIVEDLSGQPVGYVEGVVSQWARAIRINEIAAARGYPLQDVCMFVSRALKARAQELNKSREHALIGLVFWLGAAHPAYQALGESLEKLSPPYAWYLRVPDLPAFVRHVAPALERRLVGSIVEGYSGALRLNFYRDTLRLVFERGKLTTVDSYEPAHMREGDALFPDLTFLHLLFGRRGLAELRQAFPDCDTSSPAVAVLLDALFPQRHSLVNALH